ncbi:MAG: polysaccharide pyruvyl transferase CsaB [Schwartzia sp.]|nr:polysaccharide pyruvyl transferase CsaB [Schwartzia sp. (in: firmicutes)]
MSKIVVSGYYGSKNAGDEAMLAAMIEVLKDLDPELNITVISADPEDTMRRHGVKAVPWLSAGEIIKELRSADLMISGGGSLLQNVTSGRSLYYYLGIIRLSEMLGTPVMLYAQGIGPVHGSFARHWMNAISSKVSLITVRDRGSLDELISLNITRPPIEVTADPVLAIHPVDREIGRMILKKYNASGAKPLIGISVREWRGWASYKQAIAAATSKIIEECDARVVFFPMQYPEDVACARSIADMAGDGVTLLDDEYTTSELLSLVGNFDLLIGIRLHALIFAGVMGVPMVGISYDPKIDRFLDSIGERPCADLGSLTEENLMAKVRQMWQGRMDFKKKNETLLAKLRALAAKNAEMALGIIAKRR